MYGIEQCVLIDKIESTWTVNGLEIEFAAEFLINLCKSGLLNETLDFLVYFRS